MRTELNLGSEMAQREQLLELTEGLAACGAFRGVVAAGMAFNSVHALMTFLRTASAGYLADVRRQLQAAEDEYLRRARHDDEKVVQP